MNVWGIELWMVLVAAALALAAGAYYLGRKDDAVDWDSDRREQERRKGERRSGKERRSLARLLHDRAHKTNRRAAERREQDRRNAAEWTEEIERVRERVESAKSEPDR